MHENTIVTGMLMDEDTTLSFVEICQQHPSTETWLLDLLEQGLLGEVALPVQNLTLNLTMLKRVHAAYRLQHDLEINASGVVVVLELLEEVRQLRDELRVLQHHVDATV